MPSSRATVRRANRNDEGSQVELEGFEPSTPCMPCKSGVRR